MTEFQQEPHLFFASQVHFHSYISHFTFSANLHGRLIDA